MFFCAHHFEKNAAALAGCAVIVAEDREALRTPTF